jgi:hypothetical protein
VHFKQESWPQCRQYRCEDRGAPQEWQTWKVLALASSGGSAVPESSSESQPSGREIPYCSKISIASRRLSVELTVAESYVEGIGDVKALVRADGSAEQGSSVRGRREDLRVTILDFLR